MGYLNEALDSVLASSTTRQEKGKRFEPVLAQALRAHPGEWGQSRFENVWLWYDWPDRQRFNYGLETGIDLVAENTPDWGGGYVAIQSKYGFSDISTSEVDSFLAASGNAEVFKQRILVADRKIAKNGEDKIEHANPHCQILRLNEIDSWVEDWRDVIPGRETSFDITFPRHDLRSYQKDALEAVAANFETNSRGKLILPCGTGKSFVSLRIAEENAGAGKTVLCLVPSISLMGQTMREWSRHRTLPHQYIGICSDVTTGRNSDLDAESYAKGQFSELTMPVTTKLDDITDAMSKPISPNTMRVVFSTYQSSVKIMEALRSDALCNFSFDLAICDEAHRTTGIEKEPTKGKGGLKPFQLIHDDQRIRSKKRLYMTATPRVFAENIRKRMEDKGFDGQSYSMDDEETYGPEAYRMSFADAIDGGWLSDYRVVVIGVSEREYLDRAKSNPIVLEDGKHADPATVVRLAGCWDALATPQAQELRSDRDLGELDTTQFQNARSAIAFTSRIKESKTAEILWPMVATWYESGTESGGDREYLDIEIDHLDAKTPASERNVLIESLRDAPREGSCKVLSNVGVLTEGVDVPALDAVVFLQSRSSPVDVTQAVGRVMRRAQGKKFGYVVIPVVVPEFNNSESDASVEELLSASDFKPVWDVVRALRSHDERIDHMLEARTMPIELRISTGGNGGGRGGGGETEDGRLIFGTMEEINKHFGSLMLDACGDRQMYPNWGDQAGRVCNQLETRLNSLVEHYPNVRSDFSKFSQSLQTSVSPDITFEQTVRMVAHHLVTVPVFDELFGDSLFAERNPITQSMESIMRTLENVGANFDPEREPLNRAYRMMNNAFKAAEDPAKRLDVLRAIFDGFFRKAMPDEVMTMGIAYTPIELVDFIVRFTDRLCRKEFGKGLTGRDVHVLDPFAGTGTFLAHLLECKDDEGNYIIRDQDLDRKYEHEMHANELVLLAYYISALKIEETKHRRSMLNSEESDGNVPYQSFSHIVLTDTFYLSDSNKNMGMLFGGLENNTLRANDQIKAPIRVIFGNPPWSSGKDDAAETGERLQYDDVSNRVTDTYVKASAELRGGRVGGNAGGNLYVKAFRWASDRISQNEANLPSIIAFVSPNSLTDGTSLVGMRKVLRDEFTDIYVVNLRGNAYKAGEEFKKEGDKIFGGASRNGVQITFLVRNPQKNLDAPANLHYALVPERMNLQEKFDWLAEIHDENSECFVEVPVTKQHDWIDIQNPEYEQLMRVCKPTKAEADDFVVDFHCRGIATGVRQNL